MNRPTTILAGALLGLTGACTGLSSSPSPRAGTYELDLEAMREAVASTAPAEYRASPDWEEMLAGIDTLRSSIVLRRDGSFEKTTLAPHPEDPEAEVESVVEVGTWSVRDGTLTLLYDDHEHTLRITDDGLEWDEELDWGRVTLHLLRSEEVPPGAGS